MQFKKILFVTRFEDLCYDALQSLMDLEKVALEHVVFMNVIERDKVAMYRTGYKKDEEIKLREAANIRFIDWAETLFERGLEVGVYITVGSVVSQVIKAAEKEEADLIVIGRSQKGVFEKLYSGSDIAEILRRASIPVLVFKYMGEGIKTLDKPFEKPLLAMDWSAASLKAVEYLKALKDVMPNISLAHVTSDSELTGATSMAIQKLRKETRKRLDKIADKFEAEGIGARSHVYVGEPEREIERAARDNQATMIVLGSSGKPALVERWIGSLPRKIAEGSIYPTLLIPPDRE